MSDRESESFKTRVKSIEIEAEQIEQAILFAYSRHFQSTRTNIREAVTENIEKYIELKSRQKGVAAPALIDAALHSRS